MEGEGSGTPGTTVEPSGAVMGLIQQNTDVGRCLLENPSGMLTLTTVLLLLHPAAQVVWLGNHVVVFSTCGLQTAHVVQRKRAHVAAVSSQLCIAVVSYCSGSMVGQLLYWYGYEHLHVTVGRLAAVGSLQPIAQQFNFKNLFLCITKMCVLKLCVNALSNSVGIYHYPLCCVHI